MRTLPAVLLVACLATGIASASECGDLLSRKMVVAACGALPAAVARHGALREWRDEAAEAHDDVVCRRIVGWTYSQVYLNVDRFATPAAAEAAVGKRIDHAARRAYGDSGSGYSPPEPAQAAGRTLTAWGTPPDGTTVVFAAGPLAVEIGARRRAPRSIPPPILCTPETLLDLAREVSRRLP